VKIFQQQQKLNLHFSNFCLLILASPAKTSKLIFEQPSNKVFRGYVKLSMFQKNDLMFGGHEDPLWHQKGIWQLTQESSSYFLFEL